MLTLLQCLFQERSRLLYAVIATVVMLDILQTADAAPACFCMDFGRSCLVVCRGRPECERSCFQAKMTCYSKCRRSKKDSTMFDALANEDMFSNSL